MSDRKPLNQIIERVPALKNGRDIGYLQDTINLEESIEQGNREETVRLYYFAKTLKQAFEEILFAFSEPVGRGFWLMAEYGVGKSHFLSTLACLLMDDSEPVWNSVHDSDIKNYRFNFKKRKLFPIVAGLRGKTAIAQDRQVTLLEQLEKELDESIKQLGMESKINVTPVAETLNLYDGFNASLQGAVNSYIQQKSGKKPADLRKLQPDLFADYVRRFFKDQNLPFEPKYNINERLQYLYKQIVNPKTGYNGILFVIDEYESWLSQRPITSPEGMFDSSVLQALAEILPKQYNYEIFTVIASQTDIPAQLQGRFKSLPLLAGSGAERDYHVICAHRVRKYRAAMEGEAKLYYHDFYDDFAFYKADTEETFLETFPFHPLAYETVRRFTSNVQDMPGVRLGLNIFYDVMKQASALLLNRPLTLHDVYCHSANFQNALAGPRFSEVHHRFREAISLMPHIFSDEGDRIIGEAILTILYLQFVISGEQAVPLSPAELADATITPTGAITGEQRMFMILGEMAGKIPQLEFDRADAAKGARFIPRQSGPTPQQLLDKIKADFSTRDLEIMNCWTKLLFASPAETKGQKALFSGSVMDKPLKETVVAHQVSYVGDILVAGSWRTDFGLPLNDPHTHFRLVYLLSSSKSIASDLQDPRVVVIEASPLSDKLRDLCCTYLATQAILKEYDPRIQKGPEAAEIRAYAETKFGDALSSIIQYQLEPFQKGKVYTQQGVNLDLVSSLSKPTPDQRHSALIRPTLENAYNEFGKLFDVNKIDKPIVAADGKNLFTGFVQGDSSKAVRSTLEQKGVGLGLATADDPKTLNPRHSKFFEILDQRLASNPALIIWPLLKELAGNPYGIPPYLFTSMLLTYVRSRTVPSPVEVQLNPQHKLTNQSDKHLSKNLITRSNVVELKWQADMERVFDSIVTVSGPDWNSIQPFAKLIYPEAKPATFPQEIDNQINGFLSYLKSQAALVESAENNLETLAQGLGDMLSDSDSACLNNFKELYAADDLEAFDAKRKAIHAETSSFKNIFDRFTSLRQLSFFSAQLLQMLSALQKADVGTATDLSTQKNLLLVRYKLSSMIGNETAVKALLNETDKFLHRVQNAQDVHSKRMREILERLRESLGATRILLNGLGQLNQLTTLGPPQGHDLSGRFETLVDRIEAELSDKSSLHHALSYIPPEEETTEMHQRIKQGFENRLTILYSQLEKVIQGKGKDDIRTLLDLIQIKKWQEVAAKLTPTTIEIIQKILDEARTQVVRSLALETLAEQFPAIGKEDLDEFIGELRILLEKEFEKNKEGKIVVLTFK